MKNVLRVVAVVSVLAVSCGSAFGAPVVPEIDGALVVQALALVAGLGLMIKRRK